jgi:hypothetical protein
MAYDPKCEELARHFLPDNAPEEDVKELAQHIQEKVEDWITTP